MKDNRLRLLLLLIVIFFISPQAVFAIDSTAPLLPVPPVISQCFTVKTAGVPLRITPRSISSTVSLTNCTWRGGDAVKIWVLGVTAAVYEQSCNSDEIAAGVRNGVRGAFTFGGEYDLYVYCCKLEITISMSQEWTSCPNPPF